MQEVFRNFDIEGMEDCVWFDEMLIAERDKDEESFLQQAKLYLCKESLVSELKRIFTKCPVEKKTKGHPVHYMVCVKNRENRRKITALIAEALHEDVKRKIMLIFYRAPWQ